MKKRYFLQAGAVVIGAIAFSRYTSPRSAAHTPSDGTFEITRTDEEWRSILTPGQFYVLRRHGTESPFSSPFDKQFVKGNYHCAGCNLPLFSSDTKFDSGTGWPSFYAAIANAVGTREDTSLMMTRIEVHCRRCGGHLGHVFGDGPAPTGQRYCINGIALEFVPG